MKNSELPQGDLLTDEVDVNLDVLRATMMDWVGGHIDSTHIVAVDYRGERNRNVQLLEELTQPAALSHSVSHNTILSLCAGARHRRLALGGPRD